MKWKLFGIVIAGAVTLPIWAQDIKMPVNLDKLADHALYAVSARSLVDLSGAGVALKAAERRA